MSQVSVSILSPGFSPNPVTVKAGDSIIWTNQTSNSQDATSADGGVTFQTGPLPAGKTSLPITFFDENAGIPYNSTTTPGLRGTVIVSNS